MNKNPFSVQDADRRALWDMLVSRDIRAFVREDWSMIADDFEQKDFMGIHAGFLADPDAWRLSFPDLDAYKAEWLQQARTFKATDWGEEIEAALFRVTVLRDIEVQHNTALAHKKFFGTILKADGHAVPVSWQTLYYCRKIREAWKITGFTGFMPHYPGAAGSQTGPLKQKPAGAGQHKTAGPYSPVLVLNPGKIVVISGQAAIDPGGKLVGDTIEEQTACTMENCRSQLGAAGCGLNDVFKVNVYIRNLDDWPRFNKIYEKYFAEPLPVRTTVRADLLMHLLIEIEMWAIKS
jgi:enamine deaminase RidA (YjgF/YER057c/UK114 family)